MNEGLIPSLVTFLMDHNELEVTVRCCDKVEEKPKVEEDVAEEEEIAVTKDGEDNVESDTGDTDAVKDPTDDNVRMFTQPLALWLVLRCLRLSGGG